MKHLIVLPYYCETEVKNFLEIAEIWKRLTPKRVDYEFLLSARYDMEPSKALEDKFSGIAPVKSMRCLTICAGIRKPAKNHKIEGPSGVFWETMEYVNTNYDQDGRFVLWFESDMVPLVPDWLIRLDAQWRSGDYVIMGRLIDRNWTAKNFPAWLPDMIEHINGGACYCKDFCRKVPKKKCDLRHSWDMEIFKYIKKRYPFKAIDSIEIRYLHPTMKSLPESNSVLLHGVKDDSVRKYVRGKHRI